MPDIDESRHATAYLKADHLDTAWQLDVLFLQGRLRVCQSGFESITARLRSRTHPMK